VETDLNCDGTVDVCGIPTYLSTGQISQYVSDDGCDGAYGNCTVFSYDADGRVVSRNEDDGCNGTYERCTTWSYGADGFRTSQPDNGCDGVIEGPCQRQKLNAQGFAVEEGTDADCDGTADTHCITHGSDAQGNSTSIDSTDCSGGNLVCKTISSQTIQSDEGCDGSVDLTYCRGTAPDIEAPQ
jgi:hypothetical protein